MSPEKAAVSKRQARREQMQKRSQRQRLMTIGFIVLGALLIVGPIAYTMLRPAVAVVDVDPGSHSNPHDNAMGDPNAPIKIEEFSDFQCPLCGRFHEQTEPLLKQYYVDTGKVEFIYRSMGNMISDNFGGGNTESQDAASAAYCAGEQNKFWQMHELIFANVLGESVGSFTDKRIPLIAKKIEGLDQDQFNSCYDSGKYKDRVRKDFEDALAAGFNSTPSFLITYTVNGETKTRSIVGAQPFSTFQQELEAALSEIGAP